MKYSCYSCGFIELHHPDTLELHEINVVQDTRLDTN